MARELVVPWSRARMYFMGSLPYVLVHERAQHAADDRTDDGNPGVAPVRAALAGNGQYRVRESRPKIACRVDRVAGGPAERESDGGADAADEEGAESLRELAAGHEVAGRDHGEQRQDEHSAADDFRQEVGPVLTDGVR